MESTWWSALQIITSKCQACARESNRTQVLKGVLKGGYITTVPWINYSTESWESHYYYLTRGQYDWYVIIARIYIPLLFISHVCFIWSAWGHESNKESGKFRGSFFFYFLLLKVMLYSWMLYYAVDMSAGICWRTWLSCLLILTVISNEAWSTCWLDSRQPICWDIYIYIYI